MKFHFVQAMYYEDLANSSLQILTGILRHYATVLLQSAPKKQPILKIREHRSLMRGGNLRAHSNAISPTAFRARKERFAADAEKGAFLAEPENRGQPPANPLTDPAMMEGMMGMMKGNVAMMVSQTFIMSWINAFFSGFVISTDSFSNFSRSFRWWPRVAETL
jgi:hypothetical protein